MTTGDGEIISPVVERKGHRRLWTTAVWSVVVVMEMMINFEIVLYVDSTSVKVSYENLRQDL